MRNAVVALGKYRLFRLFRSHEDPIFLQLAGASVVVNGQNFLLSSFSLLFLVSASNFSPHSLSSLALLIRSSRVLLKFFLFRRSLESLHSRVPGSVAAFHFSTHSVLLRCHHFPNFSSRCARLILFDFVVTNGFNNLNSTPDQFVANDLFCSRAVSFSLPLNPAPFSREVSA